MNVRQTQTLCKDAFANFSDRIVLLFKTYFQAFGVGDGCGRGSGLLFEPVDDFDGGSSSAVLGRRSVAEELEGGITLHLELGAQFGLNGGVDLEERWV